jgi:osmoprotectant transport system substrate-binding protein
MRRLRRTSLPAALLGLTLALSACAGDEALSPEAGSGDTTQTGGGETVVVGGANFTEMQILQAMYVALLEDAGFTTETINADNRELYFPELSSATNDVAATVEAMRPLAEERGVLILEPAQAADQNGFAVTQEFAQANDLQTLTDLGELGQPVTLAATEECPQRPFCQPGLESTYGLTIASVLPTGFGGPATLQAVQSDEADLGLVATTDGTLDQYGLVLLEDDKGLQLADNVVPAVNEEAATPELQEALNSLADELTTEDLVELNRQVDAERLQPADVARSWLEEKGLIGG